MCVQHNMFDNVLKRTDHVLQTFLPERPSVHYHPRERSSNKTLISKTVSLNERDFLVRMLYKDCNYFNCVNLYRSPFLHTLHCEVAYVNLVFLNEYMITMPLLSTLNVAQSLW